jgi:ABC-2 type transport system permease protein
MHVLASEARKLATTWAIWIYVAALLAFLALVVVATFVTTDDAELDEQQLRDLLSAAGITTMLATLLGILIFTAEFRHGTAAQTFLVTPRRERVVAAKAALGLLTGALLGLVALGAVAAMAAPWLAVRDVPFDLWDGDLVALYGGVLGVAALSGAIGVALGGAIRNQVAAVVAVLLWFLVVENVVFGLVPSVGRYLPGIASNAVLDPAIENDLSSEAGWLVTLAYTGAFCLLAAALVHRRDV